ncbi:MAG: diguanylate cyclase [Pseudomonadota bacterium]|nr:diguanylate cyclase [Pseudomonadota bacterium]
MSELPLARIFPLIVDQINLGVFVVDKDMRVQLWNRYLASRSGYPSDEIVGKNLFDAFPELPKAWLEKKIHSVFVLNNFAFTSWEQRPFLFPFQHNRPVTGNLEHMRQDCTFFPLHLDPSGEVSAVCITISDATDAAIYHTQLSTTLQKLEEQSQLDGLTETFNRAYWEQRLREEIARTQRYAHPLSLVICDLDHFKDVNDECGHLAGDAVLRTITGRLRGALRKTDILGRYGGEEFGIVLPDTDLGNAIRAAERLRRGVSSKLIPFEENELYITASLGVAQWHDKMDSVESFIAAADQALYQAKALGRNRVCAAARAGKVA